MNINSVERDTRDLVQQFRGALPFVSSEAQFEILKESYRNQFKGITYVCRSDHNFPRIIKRNFDELESIQYSELGGNQ